MLGGLVRFGIGAIECAPIPEKLYSIDASFKAEALYLRIIDAIIRKEVLLYG